MTSERVVESWLTDMDGVLVHEDVPIVGATDLVEALQASGLSFLVLGNRDRASAHSGVRVAPQRTHSSPGHGCVMSNTRATT